MKNFFILISTALLLNLYPSIRAQKFNQVKNQWTVNIPLDVSYHLYYIEILHHEKKGTIYIFYKTRNDSVYKLIGLNSKGNTIFERNIILNRYEQVFQSILLNKQLIIGIIDNKEMIRKTRIKSYDLEFGELKNLSETEGFEGFGIFSKEEGSIVIVGNRNQSGEDKLSIIKLQGGKADLIKTQFPASTDRVHMSINKEFYYIAYNRTDIEKEGKNEIFFYKLDSQFRSIGNKQLNGVRNDSKVFLKSFFIQPCEAGQLVYINGIADDTLVHIPYINPGNNTSRAYSFINKYYDNSELSLKTSIKTNGGKSFLNFPYLSMVSMSDQRILFDYGEEKFLADCEGNILKSYIHERSYDSHYFNSDIIYMGMNSFVSVSYDKKFVLTVNRFKLK